MRKIITVSIALLWCASAIAGQKLEGQAALSHLQQLKAKHDRVFAAAVRLMEEKGYKPTDVDNVWRSAEPARSSVSPSAPGVERTDVTINDSSGEVTMWSWDDGDPNTWEGVVYIADYSTGANGTFNVQFDISTQYYDTVWEQTVSYTPGGGSCVDCKRFTSLDRKPVAQLASTSSDFAIAPGMRADIELVQMSPRMRSFIKCVESVCWAAAIGCISSGPGWAACFGWWCAGGVVGCGIQALK